jgi:hypothetical protein
MHILQRLAKTTPITGDLTPADASYDFAAGVWRGEKGLITFDPRRESTTKKNDLETGEDQKGQ